MIWGLCRACFKQQCLCLPWQEKELCSLRSWRWTLILTVTEPANTTPPFLMMSSAPYFWMKQTTAMWHALSKHRRHDSINFLPKICLTAGFIFQFYELLVQLFSYTDHQGKKLYQKNMHISYTVLIIPLSALSLSCFVLSVNHWCVLTKCLVYWILETSE